MSTSECDKMRDYLQKRWANHAGSLHAGSDDAGGHLRHLENCPECLAQAREIDRVDRALAGGLSALQALVETPSEDLIEATIRRVHEQEPTVQLLQRIRRPLRIILWGTFFAFTLLAASVLAVALYKALSS